MGRNVTGATVIVTVAESRGRAFRGQRFPGVVREQVAAQQPNQAEYAENDHGWDPHPAKQILRHGQFQSPIRKRKKASDRCENACVLTYNNCQSWEENADYIGCIDWEAGSRPSLPPRTRIFELVTGVCVDWLRAMQLIARRWRASPAFVSRVCVVLLPFLLACSSGCTSFSEYVHNGFKVGTNFTTPPAAVAQN